MKPSKSEFAELERNDHGEIVAIRGYNIFIKHLIANGRVSEAKKIREIRNEEVVHRTELAEIKNSWKGMK
jgi:rubrerythrin